MRPSDHASSSNRLPEEALVSFFRERRLTLSLAESCTGGMVAARLTSIPGASDIFKGGVVCYANDVKQDLLGVPRRLLETEGAVSSPCAIAMATGAQKTLKTEIAVAVTGIAGPSGGTPTKPVGLVFIGIATPEGVTVARHLFRGGRDQIRQQAAEAALQAALLAAKA